MIDISVIVPCLNAESTIGDLLDSLSRQKPEQSWELIIADNGSTDLTLSIVERYRQHLPIVRVIDASDKRGAGNARNAGAQAAERRFLAFCDADDVPADQWLWALGNALKTNAFVVSTLEYGRLNDIASQKLWRNPFRSALLGYKYDPFLPMVAASGLAIDKRLHDSVGGFDEKVRYTEDCDYGWRLQLLGHNPIPVTDAIVHVRLRETGLQLFRQAFGWGEYNALLIKRYRPFGMRTIPTKYALRAWLRLIAGIPRTIFRAARDQWLWDVGYRLGQLRGSGRFKEEDVSLDPAHFPRNPPCVNA